MPPNSVPPHYECLGVDPSISDADLSRHYRKLSLQLHPDRAAYRNDDANEAHVQARYQSITEAYAVLSDPVKRSAYDTKHGVNFQSRLVRLQTMIGQHNTSALQRSTAVEALADGSKGEAAPSRERQPDSLPNEEHICSDDDDDDDYEPAPVVRRSAERNRARPSATEAKRGVNTDASPGESESENGHEGEEYEEEDFRKVRKLFYVHPCASSSTGGALSLDELPVTQYRGVSLTRIKTLSPSAEATQDAHGPQWGLVFDGCCLSGVQHRARGEEEENEPPVVRGLTEVVFPAVVQQLNDTMIHSSTDVSRLLERYAESTAAGGDAAKETVPAGVVHDASPSSSTQTPSTAEHLHLTLAYCAVKYDLVGDTHLLCDTDVLDKVVPAWCAAAELPALMPGVRVLSVNDIPVHSAGELRRVLREVAAASLRERIAMCSVASAAKRPRTSAVVVLECCQLPFS